MSDVDEVMDGSAASDEEVESQPSQMNESSSKIPGGGGGGSADFMLTLIALLSLPVAAAAEIVEGKRAKKTVERLDFQAPKQKEKLKIGDGNPRTPRVPPQTGLESLFLLSGTGEKLGDIPRTCYQIAKMKPADLKPLHAILFDRPGKVGGTSRRRPLLLVLKGALGGRGGGGVHAYSPFPGELRKPLTANLVCVCVSDRCSTVLTAAFHLLR